MLDVIDLNIRICDEIGTDTVVSDFDLHMKEGEIVGLVGESGSGKSMSALAIAGLLSRKSIQKRGQILFEGIDLLTCDREKLRSFQGKEIGMVFQEPMTSLNPVKTIGYQVEEGLRLHSKLTKEERYQKAIEMMKKVELKDAELLYNKYPHELSGGMRQRVMIAAALICEPKLLIADEPTTALDVTIQAQILKLLKKVNQETNTSILFISHDLNVVRQICDRVLVMYQGRIVEQGVTEEVFLHPQEAYTQSLMSAVPKLLNPEEEEEVKKPPVLKVSHLNAYYQGKASFFKTKSKQKQVLRDISFEIREGEILGLVGESGCGKSTLGKSVLSLVKHVEGEVTHYSNMPQMVFQDPYGSLNPSKKIGWILEEPLRIKGETEEDERRKQVLEMLERVGLSEEYADRYPNELSGGQRQRICIALSLMTEPKLIIADEPVSALDVTVQKQIMTLLLKLNRELGIAILFISHDLRVVYEMCSRIIVMKDGRIIEQGTDTEVYFHPKESYTRELLAAADLYSR